MNKRYRRQMQLRSRRHRQGRLRSCGCHAYVVTAVLKPRAVLSPQDTFCDPVWQLRRRAKVTDLPDISVITEAMIKLAPVADTASEYFKKLREAYDAEPE